MAYNRDVNHVGNERTTVARNTKRGVIGVLAVAMLLTIGGLASAQPGTSQPADAETEVDEARAVVEFEFVDDLSLLVYWLPDEEASEGDEEEVDCMALFDESLAEDVTDAGEEAVDEAVELPDGCHSVDVVGPNGQINHGTVMSSFVHSLKDLDFDGPRGHLVRELAKSELGKGDQQVKTGDVKDEDGEDEPDEVEAGEDDDAKGPPAHARKDKKDKKDKKPKS